MSQLRAGPGAVFKKWLNASVCFRIAAVLVGAAAHVGLATSIQWNAAALIAGDADIAANGSLACAHNLSSPTIITAGTLAVTDPFALANSASLILSNGAVLDVTGVAFALLNGQQLSGSGTVLGSVALAPGTRLYPGGAGGTGLLNFSQNLELGWDSHCYFDLGLLATSGNDQVSVAGTLKLGGTIHLRALNGATPLDTTSDYLLFQVGRTTTGGLPTLVWEGTPPANAAELSLALSGNAVTLHYTALSGLAAPAGLGATVTNSGTYLVWNPVAGAASYTVKRSLYSNGPFQPVATGVTATNWWDTNAPVNAACYYRVAGVNGAGEGTNSPSRLALPAAFLKVRGCDVCDRAGAGSPQLLHGSNLGGWLFFEGWMCPGSLGNNGNALEADIQANFIQRFGLVTNDLLMDVWRANWITTNDPDALAALGMNLARVHFTYDLFQEQAQDASAALTNVTWKPDGVAFKYLDWLATEAARRHIYLVFEYQYPEGDPSSTGVYQDRFVYIWKRMGAHFAGNPAVLGYDLWNECGGGDPTPLFNLTYQTLRQVDPDHPVILEQCWWGPNNDLSRVAQAVTNYGWQNIIGEQHYSDPVVLSNILMTMRSAPTNTPVFPVYMGEFMFNSDLLTDRTHVLAMSHAGLLFSSWTLKSVNCQDWSLMNMTQNGPGYDTNALPDLLNDSAAVIAGKWAKWRTPARSQITFYSPNLVRLAGPCSAGETWVTDSHGTLNFTAAQLLANDQDLNPSNRLAVVNLALGRTAHGTVSTNAGGYVYQADGGFSGLDTLTYQDFDLRLELISQPPATVTLAVNVPAPPAGLLAQSSNNAVRLVWSAVAGATGYNLKRGDVSGGPYALLATNLSATNFFDLTAQTCRSYVYAVSALAGAYESANSAKAVGVAGGSYSPQFQSVDIGNPAAGATTACDGLLTVTAAGTDLWNGSESFRFVYAPLNGNGSITARVIDTATYDAWSKAGVMIRENLTAGSRHVAQMVSFGSGLLMLWRAAPGGNTDYVWLSGLAPYWVRVTRTNNLFTGWVSADGSYWVPVGSTNIVMATSVYAGLAATSHSPAVLGDAHLDSVSASFATNVPPVVAWTAPANQSTWIQPKSLPLQVQAYGVEGAVSNVDFWNGPAWIGSGCRGTGNLYTLNWTNGLPGNYSLSATAVDTLNVTSPPVVTAVTLLPLTLNLLAGGSPTGGVNLSFRGQSGQSYVLETSTNLSVWIPWNTNAYNTGTLWVADTNRISPQRYYRLRQ